MNTFNGIDLVLMLGLFLAVYGCAFWRAEAKRARGEGYVAGWTDATFKHIGYLLHDTDPARAARVREVYDYEKDGL